MCAKDTKRDVRLDSLKGFLILLVVLGHIIGEGDVIPNNPDSYWRGVRMWIYLFHMPLFALLSGYFFRRKNSAREFFKSLKGIAITLLIFQIIYLLLLYLIKREFSYEYFVRPYWILWYLLSLIFWRFFIQFTPKWLLQNPALYLAVVSLVAIVSGLFLPYGQILSLQRTLSFYPFFLFGYYMGQSQIRIYPNTNTKVFAWVVIILLSCFVFSGVLPDYSNRMLLGAYRYSVDQLPFKLLLFLCSLLMALSFFAVFIESPPLATIGRNSLFFYVYHGILIQFVLIPLFDYFCIPWNIITISFSLLAIVISLWFMSKNRLLAKLVSIK